MKTKNFVFLILILLGVCVASRAWADVSIEMTASKSRLAMGDSLTLDITISDADGTINKPNVGTIDGFSSYSQGHSQEITIMNGKQSSRSVFSYVLIANSQGTKSIGPFEIKIGDRMYKIAPIQVVVTNEPANAGPVSSRNTVNSVTQSSVYAPPKRALPTNSIDNQDIFVKVWFDKDEVYVNEAATLTYTLYTRLSATYKGFDKEPETTGFWIEDFPPDKTIRRTEQTINGSRYVVADVRKIAIFPTQAGIFSIDPGVLSTAVELRSDDNFDTFFSYNIFGRRGSNFPSFMSQIVPKLISADKVTLTVKELPEAGKPKNFSGAVGDYRLESFIDKSDVEVGDTVTYKLRILGEGNINTVQAPAFPALNDFKVYDSSTSTNISKERLKVEGEKIVETVMVPKKAGVFTIPAIPFVYFDSHDKTYKGINAPPRTIAVRPGTKSESESFSSPSTGIASSDKEDVSILGQDIRYIKASDPGKKILSDIARKPLYWAFNVLLLILCFVFWGLAFRRGNPEDDARFFRSRLSHRFARRQLKEAAKNLKEDKSDAFYAEISKAVYGYFADKLGITTQAVSIQIIDEKAGDAISPEQLNRIRALLDKLALGRYGQAQADLAQMKEIYRMADEAITFFEKAIPK